MIAALIFIFIQVALSNLIFVPNRWIHFLLAALPMTCAILGVSISGKFSKRVGI
jgi:hypothetical protein